MQHDECGGDHGRYRSESIADKTSYDVYHLSRLAGGKHAVTNPICSREFLGGMTIHDVAYLVQKSYFKDGLGSSCVSDSEGSLLGQRAQACDTSENLKITIWRSHPKYYISSESS